MSDLRERSIEIIRHYQAPSGAYVACPNFAPYRFCWLRDGTFTAYAMDRAGQHDSARRFYLWVDSVLRQHADRVDRIAHILAQGHAPSPSEMLPTRYRLDGAPEHDSWPNFQLDGYGTWLWGLAEHVAMTGETELVEELHDSVSLTIRYISLCWKMPNYDCWEEFGDRLHPATLACLYGGLMAARRLVKRAHADEVVSLAAHIRDYILEHGVAGGRFVKSIGNPSVDASLLWLAVPFAVVDPFDPLMQCTLTEVERRLYHHGVHRYSEDTYYGGGEWPLLACWLGWYYCRAGRPASVAPILDWVERCANERGELPEQVSDHVNDPAYLPQWQKRWGPVATPLLWSHAMYLILLEEIQKAAAQAGHEEALGERHSRGLDGFG